MKTDLLFSHHRRVDKLIRNLLLIVYAFYFPVMYFFIDDIGLKASASILIFLVLAIVTNLLVKTIVPKYWAKYLYALIASSSGIFL